MKKSIRGANPYMPLWEHVPDGEPVASRPVEMTSQGAHVIGRHAVYFEFLCEDENLVAGFDRFTFDF